MAQSKHRPAHKAKKKKATIRKQKKKEMENIQKEGPVTYTYHKDAEFVKVPIKAWQTLNMSAKNLQDIAMFVSTMEQVGQFHMTDGTLLPVFKDDLEIVPGQPGPNGQPQFKIKDTFWGKGSLPTPPLEKPSIIMADGKTVYDASKETPVDVVAPSTT